MDFLISEKDPTAKPFSRRYNNKVKKGSFFVSYSESGNLRPLRDAEKLFALVSGSLYGPLADKISIENAEPNDWLRQDGSFTVAVLSENEIKCITDAGGSIPTYYAHGPRGFAVGTLVHHVAEMSGLDKVDMVSAVDYIFNQAVCYPYSWFEGVRVLPPGSLCFLDAHSARFQTYWEPVEKNNVYAQCDARAWGEELHKRVKNVINLGISDKTKGRLLYSGGMDSRAVLSLIPERFNCIPTTVLDCKNREYRIAELSARLLGRELEWIQHPKNFYRSHIRERIELLGPGRDFKDSHFCGPVGECLEDSDLILGGYLSDGLFKTYHMGNVIKKRFRPESLIGPLPDVVKKASFLKGKMASAALWNEFAAAARERRIEHHRRLKELRPRTAGNWHTLWPLTNRTDFGHCLNCRRLKPEVLEPFSTHQLYQLAAEMPDTARIDKKAFRYAFRKSLGPSGWFPTSSGELPRIGGVSGTVATRFVNEWRKLKRVFNVETGYQGPWSATGDNSGWKPVVPSHHMNVEQENVLEQRLKKIVPENQIKDFFEQVEQGNVRALTLAFY